MRSRFELGAQVEEAFNASGHTYGAPRLQVVLKRRGVLCSRRTVARLMRERSLVARARRPWVQTTRSNSLHAPARRLFKTEDKSTAPQGPNEVWVGDVTHIWVADQFYYLAVVLDVFHRGVVGWSLTSSLDAKSVIAALKMAFRRTRPDGKVIFHSDRGSQYTSAAFKSALAGYGGILSMSRKGNCFDNAVVESFFKSLKTERLYKRPCMTYSELRHAIFAYIEGWYNPHRLHSSLNYQSPKQFLQNRLKNQLEPTKKTPAGIKSQKTRHLTLDT